MVKVLRLSQFCGQEVFSSDSEPVAVACAGQWLFLANAKRTVEVHSLALETRSEDAGAKDAHCRFSTISDVVQLAYNEKAECVVALEKMKARKGTSRIARVYSNWLSGSLAQPARIRLAGSSKRHVQVLQQERMSHKRAVHESKQLEVVELPVVESTSCISCCSVTGNVLVGGSGVIRLFVLCQSTSTWQEFEQFADIQVDLICARVSICEDYIAAISKDEVVVLKINVSAEGDSAVEERVIDHKISAVEDDDNLVVCDFTTSLLSTSNFPPQVEVIQLDSMKGQAGHVEKLQEPVEVLGPVRRVTRFPISVKMAKSTVKAYLRLFGMDVALRSGWQNVSRGDRKRAVIGSCIIMLYKKFSEMELGGSMHSLQLVPTFQAVSDGVWKTAAHSSLPCPLQPSRFLHEVRELVGMGCFVSGTRQGYMYDVLNDTLLLSMYPYTHNTNAAAVGSYFIQAISNSGLETYTLRNFAHSVHKVRNKQKAHGAKQSKLEPQTLFEQMCPPADFPICLVGVHPFVGLCGIVTSGEHVVLLSKASETERAQADLLSRSFSKVRRSESAECTEWGVYVLTKFSAEQLFKDMMEMADPLKLANPPVYHQALCEGNLLLRSQLNSAHVRRSVLEAGKSHTMTLITSDAARGQALLTIDEEKECFALLQQSCIALAEFYCIPAGVYPEHAVLYYGVSGVSLVDVMQRFLDRKTEKPTVVYSHGLTKYLMSQLFPCDGLQLAVSEDVGNAIIEVFASVDQENLSTVLLESRLKIYSREKAIHLLYAGLKEQQASKKKCVSRDALALAVLHLELCEVDGAQKAVKSVQLGDLYDICEEKCCYLIQNGSLSPLGQLICRHETGAFVSAVLYMYAKGIVDLDETLHILGVSDMKRLHENKYACYYLEAFLCDVSRSQSFAKSMDVLVRLYVQQLKQSTSQTPRGSSPVSSSLELKKVVHCGCYGFRPSWLQYLPPFRGGSAKQRSARIRYTGQRPSDRMPGRQQSDHVDFLDRQSQARLKMSSHHQITGMRYEHQSLINLQSLLCSDYASESLAQVVLDELDACGPDGLRDVELSLKALCLPRVGFKIQALDLLINSYPDCLVSYSKSVPLDMDEWQHVLSCLLTLCQQEPTQSGVLDAYKGCLDHLADVLSSKDFLALLPLKGSAAFFLPYIQRNCVASLGASLQQRLIDQCKTQDKVSPW